MSEKVGIKELRELTDWVFDISDAIIASIEDDGKVTLADAPRFIQPLIKAPSALGGINQIPQEIANISDEDMDALITLVKDRFKITDKKLEGYIENIFYSALQLAYNVGKIYKLGSAKTA